MKKIILLVVSCLVMFAEEVKVGDIVKYTEFQNQFDKELKVTKETKQLIVVFSKEIGELVKEFLEKNSGYLEKNSAVYLADISSAPGFVTKLFMKPKFRDYPYVMGMIYDEEKASYFPKKEEKITILTLKDLKVEKIEFLDSL